MESAKFQAITEAQFREKMAALSMDGRCWVGWATFGMGGARAFAIPSRITLDYVGLSPMNVRGYWRDGKLHEFTPGLLVRYQNSGIGRD